VVKEKKMDVNFSVFNQHINKADKRALRVMKDNFPILFKEIKEIEEVGIMSIFQKDPTNATLMYTALVTAFVNKY
jgi:hypothetical protein